MIPDLYHTDEHGLIRSFIGSKPRKLDRKHKPTKTNISQPKTPQHVGDDSTLQQVGDYLIETPNLEKTLLKKVNLQQKREEGKLEIEG